MTQEDKELLLQDLCGRLPYGVKIQTPTNCWTSEEGICELKEIFKGDDGLFRIGDVGALIEYSKPYLFPMSSMTKEQSNTYHELIKGMFGTGVLINIEILIDFFNKNHLDYRGLIPSGLALNATGLNIY